ncbi:MAG TPA: UbiA family prenyltransferase, partial [Actinomycetota bacterium]|nr:UbiA family prenyltransferase [Actinomycetota bacterium]
FGLALLALGQALFAALAGPIAAGLALAGAAWYVLVYTLWLKPRTPWNIVLGGAAGSFPTLAGWAAATGGRLSPTAWALALVVFLWTPAHFWALATVTARDYRRAGVPMLPAVAGAGPAAARMLRYAVLTLAASLAPLAWGGLGLVYAGAAIGAGAWFVAWCARHRRSPGPRTAGAVFRASGTYLLAIFAAAVIDRSLR